jgi:hypothetical protein
MALYAFVIVPFLAVLAAVPVAWGGWLSWTDIAIGAVFYVVSGLGITVGFHRTSRTARSRRSAGCGSPGAGRLAGDRGQHHPVGGRPPAAPHVQRPGG